MKNLFIIVLAVLALSSCNNQEEIRTEINEGTKFRASLDLSSVVISSQSMKTETPKEDLYGIQIKKKEGGDLIAKGLFTGTQIQAFKDATSDDDKLSVELEHNVAYIVESTMVKESKDVEKDPGNPNAYSYPFHGWDVANVKPIFNEITTDVNKWEIKNVAEEVKPFYELSDDYGEYNELVTQVVNQERWYYIDNNFVADYKNPEIDIEMKRTSFQVNYNIENIASNMKVVGVFSYTNQSGEYYSYANMGQLNFNREDDGTSLLTKICNIRSVESAFTNDEYKYQYLVEFYIFNNSETNIDLKLLNDRNKAIKVCRAVFDVKRNTKYKITLDANTNKDNMINISAQEDWIDETTEINAEEKIIYT